MTKKIKIFLLLAFGIRLVLAGISYHEDSRFFVFSNYIVSQQNHWLDFYDYLGSGKSEPLAQVYPPTVYTYPPLAILSQAVPAKLTYLLVAKSQLEQFILKPENLSLTSLAIILVLTKLPLILWELWIGTKFAQLLPDKWQTAGLLAWWFNPVLIYATAVIGQFDTILAGIIVLAWLAYRRQQFLWAAWLLGLGASFKLAPLLLLPLLLHHRKNVKHNLQILSTGLLGYLLPVLPYLPSPGFRTYALLAPQTDKLLFAKMAVTGAEYLSLFLVGYSLILAWQFWQAKPVNLLVSSTMVLLWLFSVSHYHPQWLVWLVPGLLWLRLTRPVWRSLINLIYLLYWSIVLSFDNTLSWGVLRMWWPQVNQIPNLYQLLDKFMPKYQLTSIERSLFAGLTIYLIWQLSQTAHKSKA